MTSPFTIISFLQQRELIVPALSYMLSETFDSAETDTRVALYLITNRDTLFNKNVADSVVMPLTAALVESIAFSLTDKGMEATKEFVKQNGYSTFNVLNKPLKEIAKDIDAYEFSSEDAIEFMRKFLDGIVGETFIDTLMNISVTDWKCASPEEFLMKSIYRYMCLTQYRIMESRTITIREFYKAMENPLERARVTGSVISKFMEGLSELPYEFNN